MEENEEKTSINQAEAPANDKNEASAQKMDTTKSGKAIFSIFMVCIYFGMAYLTLGTDFFFWIRDEIRYAMGTIFIVYGLWRGYRQFKK